jgi:hypothetical protein
MASYANDLRLKEITTGDEDGTWGTSTNTNLSLIADAFSYGTKQMVADADETFTMPDATADAVRSFYVKITSAVSLTATRTVTLAPSTISKVWIIENATTGSQSIIIKQGSGSTVTIASGKTAFVYTDGAGGTGAVTNVLTGTTMVTPVLGTPASGTLTNCTGLPLTTGVTGTLPIANIDYLGQIYLSTTTAAAQATVDVESGFSATYDNYVLVGSGVTLSGADKLYLRMKIGGSYITTSTYYCLNADYSGTVALDHGLVTFLDANGVINFTMDIFDVNSANAKSLLADSIYRWTTGIVHDDPGTLNTNTGVLTGIRFYCSGGATITGTFHLYGLKNA